MKKMFIMTLVSTLLFSGYLASAIADESVATLPDAFKNGDVSGTLKSYYFSQTFDGAGKNDSSIWAYGGNLKYVTADFLGLQLGTNIQVSAIAHKDDDDNRTAGSMDAEGAVLSEAYLQYKIMNTTVKGGRQFVNLPLLSGSGSRLIKEAFEAYFITNQDLLDTQISVGWARKYGTRTDRSSYGDNPFVRFENNGDGDPGTFVDIGDDGMILVYLSNSSINGLDLQAQYVNVDDVNGLWAIFMDAKYTLPLELKPFIAAQYYYTDWDQTANNDNDLFGFKAGLTYGIIDLFAGYTSASGGVGETRVFRGVGQGAYYNYTSTTKTAGAPAFEPGTDAYQIGIASTYQGVSGKFRYTNFDNPAANTDLEEYTFNLAYNFNGALKGVSISADYSILDYENDSNDATDLRTRLIYTF